jgi:hypothetical protein
MWQDREVQSALSIVLRVLSDPITWCGRVFRPRNSLEAEILFFRRQLALYVERGVKPRRIDAATRVSLAFLSRWFACRSALIVVRPAFPRLSSAAAIGAAAFQCLADGLLVRHELILGEGQLGNRRAVLQIVPVGNQGQLSRQGGRFTWQILFSAGEGVAQQLSALANSPRPAHVYIDPPINRSGVQVLASMGEYEPGAVLRG